MKPTEIEKWLETVNDFFDLSKDPNEFGTRYNKAIKTAMRVWRGNFLKMSVHFPEVAIDFYYITGDDAEPDDYANDACSRVKVRIQKPVNSTCNIYCVSAKQLCEQLQKRPPKSKTLNGRTTHEYKRRVCRARKIA